MYLYKRSKGTQVAYWRKANAIRKWFVDHNYIEDDDNCTERLLDQECLEALLKDCKAVKEDHSKATDLLPTEDGFFFGSTEYEDRYFECIDRTIMQLEDILSNTNWEEEDIFYHDWW